MSQVGMNQVGAAPGATAQHGGAAAGNLPARQDGPVQIPPSSASGGVPAVAQIPRAFPLIPEPEEDGDGGASMGHNYVVGGNVLGIVLGIITVTALVWALVIALRADNSPEALAARSSSNRSANGGDNSGALDTDTSASGGSTAAAGDAAAAGSTGTDTAGAAAADSGAAAAGGGGAAAGGAAGGFKFAPATGTYAVTGTGFRKNTPPGNSVPIANPSLVVAAAGNGCYTFKYTVDPGNWNEATNCGTSDGGLVLTKNVQYIKTTVASITEENIDTMICTPPDINLPANPAPGVGGSGGGSCIGVNSSDKAPGKNKQTSKFTVTGKETVAGVEAWHVKRDVTLEPADTQNTQKGTIAEDYWWATNNGMLLRWKQNTNVTSTVAGVIPITFVQQIDLAVTSPNPS